MRDDVRAAAVAALGAAVLAACTPGGDPAPGPTGSPTTAADPDAATLREWVAAEQDVVARYDDAMALAPGLADQLTPLRDHHAAHAAALLAELGEMSPSPSASPSASPSPSLTRAVRRIGAGEAVRRLAEASRDAARAYRTGTGRLSTPARALLAAELAASESQHATLLALLPVEPRRG